ncbi:sulfurtransferase [Mycobacterium kiyosense]|uniref:Sulfurtransferase n=1 Tax=Mycobacterium kiyosense TaxID=2871094 RepID=A0A9P3Q6L4_9MYCO|nr:sulfurtransferase [Mycobacterium kiyosense]GLB84033.1 putative thiosulfate sulfurtransferase SseB [Mycobacterium kiyosense]GLB96722.1 putative thiosulfate sulfurtransferase SseB [Mycobacterium kiyosense]GLD30095.1 putative thiosulfate sulfurtransferase SseB [Mycobacterium kiyosense]GLD38874.1 putative thiosulfate sulfurtransferase SseB [Mycobacterium kiyosense]
MSTREQVLISPAELAGLIDAGEPVSILDVRWRLDTPDGRPAYLDGHLPGAVYVSLEDDLSDHTVSGRGRHPLPSGSSLQESLRRCGVCDGVPIVVYDDWNRAGSARAWWVLTAAGLTDVRILDGGLSAWRASDGQLESGPVAPPTGNVTVPQPNLYAGSQPTLTADEAGAARMPLFDARAPERYRGEVEPVDAVGGHIPGAKNLPFGSLLTADGTLLGTAELHDLLSANGIEPDSPVGTYCGSGVTAAVVVAALAAAGQRAALFPGSWSEWSSDPARPVERG